MYKLLNQRFSRYLMKSVQGTDSTNSVVYFSLPSVVSSAFQLTRCLGASFESEEKPMMYMLSIAVIIKGYFTKVNEKLHELLYIFPKFMVCLNLLNVANDTLHRKFQWCAVIWLPWVTEGFSFERDMWYMWYDMWAEKSRCWATTTKPSTRERKIKTSGIKGSVLQKSPQVKSVGTCMLLMPTLSKFVLI